MAKKPPPPDPQLRDGLWFQVDATIRPLEQSERPAWSLVPDDRMVVFGGQTGSGMAAVRWTDPYSPVDTPALSADFMRLFGGASLPRDQRVIEFYREYGPLRQKTESDGRETGAWVERLSAPARRELSAEVRLLLCEPLWSVAEVGREMRLFYEVYRALASDDLTSLRSILGGVPQGEEVRGVRLAATGISLLTAEAEPEKRPKGRRRSSSAAVERPTTSVPADVARRPLTDEECRRWGNQVLADQLTAAQQHSSVKWMVDDESGEYQLVRGRTFPDLAVGMYLQLGDMMEQGEIYRTCEGCGGPFWSRGGKRKFCDTLCGDAYRQRRFYRHPRPRAASSRDSRTRRSR